MDLPDNVQSIVDGANSGKTTYGYDTHNRLTTARSAGYTTATMNYSRSISFSKNGNWTNNHIYGSRARNLLRYERRLFNPRQRGVLRKLKTLKSASILTVWWWFTDDKDYYNGLTQNL